MNDLLATILDDVTAVAIYRAAYEQARAAQRTIAKLGSWPSNDEVRKANWEKQMDEATGRMEYAKGMAAAVAYLPGLPFEETITPVKVLEQLLEDDELAQELYK